MNRAARRILANAAAAALLSIRAAAQTDYYNTDAGRPITVEDASPVERRAFELQLAPLRLERATGGAYQWGVEPEVAYGILPRTHVEVGLPLQFVDGGTAGAIGDGGRRSGIAGLHLGLFHNLNVETAIPALAVAASALLPFGNVAPARTYLSGKAIATKTLSWARFHVNGEYTFGDAPSVADRELPEEVARWLAGLAVDRTLPLRSILLTAEVVARRPIVADDRADDAAREIAWSTGAGMRYQYSPRLALDAGLGRRLTGPDPAWSITFGSALAFGLPWYPR